MAPNHPDLPAEARPEPRQVLHVVFTPDGIPGWIGTQPRDGSEPVEDLPIPFLAAHLRLPSGEWVPRPPPPPPTATEIAERRAHELESARGTALRNLDSLIEVARARFVTLLPGQEAIYQAKEAEARSFLARVRGGDDLDDFPYLAAEVGITAPTAHDLAQLWLQRGAVNRRRGAETERMRFTAREAIRTARTVDALDSVIQAVVTQIEQMG